MSCETSNFFQKLTRDQFAQIGLGTLFVTLNHLIPKTIKLLKINMDRYRMVPIVDSVVPNTPDMVPVYQTLCDIFPTFPFIISGQLKSQPSSVVMGEEFQIAGIGSSIAQYNSQQTHIGYFLKYLDLSVDLLKPASMSNDAQKFSYLPKLVKGDLILIAKNLQWQPSQKPFEMIEHHYCMQGLTQIFLRYYFDLIAFAESDEVAQYIDNLFLNFFISLRYQVLQYWQNYPNAKKIKARLLHTIAKDSPLSRHPVLGKPFFDQIEIYNPIIHHGGARKMTTTMKNLFEQQWETFQSFSLQKKALFLRVLSISKGDSYPRYLFLEIAKTDPNMLVEFKDLLQSSPEASANFPELLKVLEPILEQMRPQTVLQEHAIFQKIDAIGIFSDFDLLSQMTRGRIFQGFERMVNSLELINQDDEILKEKQILTYLKNKKITSNAEVEISTELIQWVVSVPEEEQSKLMNDLRQIKSSEINREVFGKIKNLVQLILKHPAGIKERLFKAFDHYMHRITEVLGKEKLISLSTDKLARLKDIFQSVEEDKARFIHLFSLVFSCPLIIRPAIIDHFLKIVNNPEMMEPQSGVHERNMHLRSTVDRSLQDKRLQSKMKEVRVKQQISASPVPK